MFKKYQHIHFVGIGGIGMSGIAQVLLTLGYKVTGSDLRRSDVTKDLVKRGAKVFVGHRKENVGKAHVVVVSSAVDSNNPEVMAAVESSVPVVPRAEMLAELMRLKYGIAIAGTHGKTTTTSLVATILTSAGLDPTMVIGGKVNSFRTNARLGRGDFLVAEADESDRSFIKLSPTIAVVTNIDPEHMENYRDFEHVKETYVSFANKVPFYGSVIACVDHPEVKNLVGRLERRVVTYGVNDGDFTAENIGQKEGILTFDVRFRSKKLGNVKLGLPGRHNVLNSLAAIAVSMELDVPFKKISEGLKKFKGIERRFQILSKDGDGPMIVTDYAHHPKEIEAVLASVRENWPLKKIVCVVQPHRYTRLASLFNDFVETLMEPDLVVIMPVYSAGEKPVDGVSSIRLFEELVAKRGDGRPTYYSEDKEEMFNRVKELLDKDSITLFLGAGDIWKMGKEFVKNYGI